MASYPDYYLLPIPLVVTISFAIFLLKNREKMNTEQTGKACSKWDMDYNQRCTAFQNALTGIREDILAITKTLTALSSASFLAVYAYMPKEINHKLFSVAMICWLCSICFVVFSFMISIIGQHIHIKCLSNPNLQWNDKVEICDNGQIIMLLLSVISCVVAYISFTIYLI